MSNNIQNLKAEVEFLTQVFKVSVENEKLFGGSNYMANKTDIDTLVPPQYDAHNSSLGKFLNEAKLSFNERILFSLALCIHVSPDFLQIFKVFNQKPVNAFGSVTGKNFQGAIPTGLTWLFIVAGQDLEKRMSVIESISSNKLFRARYVIVDAGFAPEPYLNGPISMDHELLFALLTNTELPQKTSTQNATEIQQPK